MKKYLVHTLVPAAFAALLAGGIAGPVFAGPADGNLVVAQADKPAGQGTLNTIDAKAHKLNITHAPIAALQWPGMTMDFGVASGVDLGALKAGSKVTFTLGRGPDGAYVIDSVKSAE